ncbi:MAG: hypothetical protein CMO80_09885 [Verrucomicrobiales bacterium]|nr:hypothetical protein [Verrucomicrobiales bacterium]|tara:strand:+ start:1122 stop:1355 length:234 start_codon:yes stop_codon:yes gene_type:complete
MTIKSVISYELGYGAPKPSELKRKEAVQFALRLLMTASEFDSATGGVDPNRQSFATIRILTGEGIEAVTEDDQARCL